MSYTHLPLEPFDPPLDVEKDTMPDGHYRVYYWSQLNSLKVEELGKPERILHFPRFTYQHDVIVKKDERADYVWSHSTKRVRNYLSLFLADSIPLYYKIVGKDAYLTGLFSNGLPYFNPSIHLYSQQKINDEFNTSNSVVVQALNSVNPDSYKDMIANLFGSIFWRDDLFDRFMYSWRVIELFSNETINSFSRDDFGTFGQHISDKRLPGFIKKIYICDKIEIALRKELSYTEFGYLHPAYELRNKIHGAVKVEDFSSSTETIKWVYETAQDIVKKVFGDILPKT